MEIVKEKKYKRLQRQSPKNTKEGMIKEDTVKQKKNGKQVL